MPSILTREPVGVAAVGIGAAITGVVVASIALINSFHPGAITQAQSDALVGFVAAAWLLLGLMWVGVRPLVTPTAPGATKLPEGHPVQLPDGTTGSVVKS